jgi:hypothetical protein
MKPLLYRSSSKATVSLPSWINSKLLGSCKFDSSEGRQAEISGPYPGIKKANLEVVGTGKMKNAERYSTLLLDRAF